jgi:hypothetical protein
MATPPDFSVGQVLTAAHMDAVGLWLVKSQAVGTGVSSVTVTGAFNADYENYYVTYTNGTATVDTNMTLKLGSTATGYYGAMAYTNYSTGVVAGAGDSNTGLFSWGGGGTNMSSIQIFAPNLAKATEIETRVRYQAVYGVYIGVETSTTQHTAFTIAAASGTLTGGTIRVYGYRN